MEANVFQLGLATVPVIDDILRDGARRALQLAIEREVEEYIERHKPQVDDQGRRLVVRNGHHPARTRGSRHTEHVKSLPTRSPAPRRHRPVPAPPRAGAIDDFT